MPRIQEELEAKLTRLSASLKAALTREMLADQNSATAHKQGCKTQPFLALPVHSHADLVIQKLKRDDTFPSIKDGFRNKRCVKPIAKTATSNFENESS